MMKKIIGIYKIKSMLPLKKILIGLITFFVVFTIVGFFVLPPILKSILIKKLSENLHREVIVKYIHINPYTLSLTLKGFTIKDHASPETFVSLDELYLNLQSLSALKMSLIIKEIRLKQPYIRIRRNEDTSYNFSDLLGNKEPKTVKKSNGKPKSLRFSFNNIRIENGSIDFLDGPKQTKHTIREMNIGIPFLSNIPSYFNIFVQPAFSAKINDTPYMVQGKTKPFADSLETVFDININDLDIPHYLAYLPMKLNFKIVSAFLDAQTKVSFTQYQDKRPSLTVTGKVSLKKVLLEEDKKNPLLRLPLLDIEIAPTEPLKKVFHLSKVSLQSPELEIRQNQTGALNIDSIFPEKKESQSPPASENKEDQIPLSIDIDEVLLTNGSISFSDFSRNKPFKTILDPIGLRIDHFSNRKEQKTAYTLSITSEAKESIKLEGELSMEPLWAEGGLEIKSVPIKKYSPYYQDQILFNFEEGYLDFFTHYKYAKKEKKPEFSLSGMSVILKSIRLKKQDATDEEEGFLNIPVLMIQNCVLDLNQKEIFVGDFSTQKGVILVRRLKDGKLNLQTLFPEPAEKKETIAQEKSGQTEKPWLINLGKISVEGYRIRGEDRTTADLVTMMLDDIQLKANNLSTADGKKGNASLSLRLNQRGIISTEGTIGINPISTNLKMSLKEIEVKPFQPYFTDKIRIMVADGTFSTNGNLILDSANQKELKATYTNGEASLNNFISIDKINAGEFFKIESITFDDIHFVSNPFLMNIKGIALNKFYAHLLINPDGKLNIQEILQKEDIMKEASSKKVPPPSERKVTEPSKEKESSGKIKIGAIMLQQGMVDFSDKSINPEFSAKLSDINGRISDLSSEDISFADMELKAKLNNYAPLEIIGKINPLKQDLYVDLKVSFKDMDLSPVTPYSGKYAGYSIQKGKLSFDLNYMIDKRKLDARNSIFLDQFTFGDRVESPQATKLPVKLAIALLKNRKGEINLDIPVSGSLDDPKFSVGGIILKIILNLIAKAATSPFALLGAIFGGGEELSYIDFNYGVAIIEDVNKKKIETLVKALSDRPALKLDIEGYVDSEKDREELKQLFFQRKLKVQKLKEIVKRGASAVPVDEVKIEKQEYEKYLKMAYKEEKFQKPRNILGIAKNIPVPEMEKLIFTHIKIKESDLRSLAYQRSMSVKDSILKMGTVEPERIFIIEPKSLSPEKKENLKDSRVNFKLK